MALTLTSLAAGCSLESPTASDAALCAGTRTARADLAAALAASPDDAAVVAGANLIAKIDAGCLA